MSTYLGLLLLVLAESVALVWACRNGATGAGLMIKVNLLLIALFAPVLVQLGDRTTSIACVFYVTVVCAQCVLLENFGYEVVKSVVWRSSFVLTLMFLVGFIISHLPVVPGNETFMQATTLVCASSVSAAAAAFVAFLLSQFVLIRTWEAARAHYSATASYLLGSFICQLVETPIFFVVAFWDKMSMIEIIEMTSTGLLFNLTLTVLMHATFKLACTASSTMRTITYTTAVAPAGSLAQQNRGPARVRA